MFTESGLVILVLMLWLGLVIFSERKKIPLLLLSVLVFLFIFTLGGVIPYTFGASFDLVVTGLYLGHIAAIVIAAGFFVKNAERNVTKSIKYAEDGPYRYEMFHKQRWLHP